MSWQDHEELTPQQAADLLDAKDAEIKTLVLRLDAAVQLADARYREIEKLIAERDSATFRLVTAESQRDEAMTLLNAACDAAEADWKAKAIEAERGRLAAVDRLLSIRKDTIQECWNLITSHVQAGSLQGNGCDDTAQRNGMILAANVLYHLGVAVEAVHPSVVEIGSIKS
jgi:hypothetical protein